MQEKQFSFRKRLRSFSYAFQGIRTLLSQEHNAWIHCLATVVACAAGWYFEISSSEWIAVIIVISLVLAAEAFNTAIEKIADFISTEHHPAIKDVKDLAAGGVLFTAIGAAVVGLIIFLPKVISIFG